MFLPNRTQTAAIFSHKDTTIVRTELLEAKIPGNGATVEKVKLKIIRNGQQNHIKIIAKKCLQLAILTHKNKEKGYKDTL